MKFFIVTMVVAAVAFAEPPPSKSYLPPSPSSRNSGYPKGPQGFNAGPQVVAARTLEGQGNHGFGHDSHAQNGHDAESIHGNGFGRSSHGHGSGAQGRHGDQQGYDHNAAAFGRNAVEAEDNEPANYNFGYMVNDQHEGTEFGHQEERHEEHAQGEYHVVLPDGRKQTVSYQADERGFKPQISYEETDDLTRSGYDANANNARAGYDANANHAGYDANANGFHGNGHDVETDFGRNAERGHGSDFSHHAESGFGRNAENAFGRNAEPGFGRNAENAFGRNAENGHNGKSRNGY